MPSNRVKKLLEEARKRAIVQEREEVQARLEKEQRKAERPKKLPPFSELLVIPEWVRTLGVEDPKATFRINVDQGCLFEANPGPQTWALFCPYNEVLIGGRRGGGKSVALTAWMASGDVALGYDDPARPTYLNDPAFRGLFLREEYQSMVDFIDYAIDFFAPFGGKPTGKPVVLTFPSGAKIYFNHLQDDQAFEKYRGWSLTRIGIEELTQIPTLKRYLRLMGSLRSVERIRNGRRVPELRTQIMASCNPDGPGAPWVKSRFVYVPNAEGVNIPWNTPMQDPVTGLVRIFIPFPREANPYLGDNTSAGRTYNAMLLSQDALTQRQWIYGDWEAGSSRFFLDYRPDGPASDDEIQKFPWAFHIIKPQKLQDWWFRWGSGDWGYDHPAAMHKLVQNEGDKRVHVYDELQVRRVGSFELGAQLAKWWYPELIAYQKAGIEPGVVIHFGRDIFDKTDETKTPAQLMAQGIQEVLGPYGAILLKFNEDEQEAMMKDPKRAQLLFERRKAEIQGHIHIALKPVYVDRVKAWSYMREWLRFRPAVLALQTEEDRIQYLQQVYKEQGTLAYEMQLSEMRSLKPEILPKLQIWSNCVEIDRCLRVAERDMRGESDPSGKSYREDVRKFNADDEGKNGDDALESVRNAAIAYQEIKTIIPRSFYVNERIADAQKEHKEAFGEEINDPTRMAMIAMRQNAIYSKDHSPMNKGLTRPRQGASSRMVH